MAGGQRTMLRRAGRRFAVVNTLDARAAFLLVSSWEHFGLRSARHAFDRVGSVFADSSARGRLLVFGLGMWRGREKRTNIAGPYRRRVCRTFAARPGGRFMFGARLWIAEGICMLRMQHRWSAAWRPAFLIGK